MPLSKRHEIPRTWEGLTAIVVCSGPSLSTGQVRAIAKARNAPDSSFRVIAVNDAVYPCWFADHLHSCDARWWRNNVLTLGRFAGVRTSVESDIPWPWTDGFLLDTGQTGYDPDPSNIRTGRNSGYQAIHIAMHYGAARIVLVGMDMKAAAGGAHFFGNHAGVQVPQYAKTMVPLFESLRPALADRGIDVVNATPGSALEAFPAIDLDYALALTG